MANDPVAARLRVLARSLILEAEALESKAAPEGKKKDWRQDMEKLKQVAKKKGG